MKYWKELLTIVGLVTFVTVVAVVCGNAQIPIK